MKQDKFSNRYLIKLLSSVLIAIFNIAVQFILPRAFSVEEYGFYSYNLNIFTSVVVMANLSMSDAMVSKFSKRNEELGLVYFYLIFYLIISSILNFLLIIFYPSKLINGTFNGQSIWTVLLGLNTSIMIKILSDTISMYDAIAVSRLPALINILLKLVVSLVVSGGYLLGILNLNTFYIFQFALMAGSVALLLWILLKEHRKMFFSVKVQDAKFYAQEFIGFCKPLVAAMLFSQAVIIIMNWSLMRWSGVAEQALFGAAWQINTLVSYVFSPYAELMKREFAVNLDDREALARRFHQALLHMFWFTSYFAVFCAVLADWILPIIFGEKYQGSVLVTQIIMIYTIYQAWGQINGSLLLAEERTKENAIFSMVSQLLTLLCVWLFQIPNFIWPDSLGALGIALNYLLVNVIITLLKMTYNAKSLGLNSWKEHLIPVPVLTICFFAAGLSKMMVNIVFSQRTFWMTILKTFIAGGIYTLTLIVILLRHSALIEVDRKLISSKIDKFRKKWR